MISIIAAIGENRELGKDNKLLWNISEDLKRFKQLTTGHPVIMGRKTYESMGRLLPNRTNIIITRDQDYKIQGATIVYSLEEAITQALDHNTPLPPLNPSSPPLYQRGGRVEFLNEAEKKLPKEVFIIGGGQIYKQVLPLADKLYLTIVHQTYPEADTYFPDYSMFNRVISKQEGFLNNLCYTFLDLEK